MKNITNEIKNAIQTNVLWSVDEFYLFLEVAAENNLEISYWDNEENWATLLFDNIVVGYVYRKFPLALLLKEHSNNMKSLLIRFEYLVSIFVTDLVSNQLIIEDDPVIVERFGAFAYNQSVSATDIWFSTMQ